MRRELLHYYERELSFIRKLSREFSEKYPEVAGRLQLEANASADPHVERLIEAFAMLTARVQLRLDDDFPEITDAILGILYPHYLAPVPSLGIVQLHSAPDGPIPADGLHVARNTLLYSKPVPSAGGMRCRFRTAYPVTLWPLEIASIDLLPSNQLRVPVPPEARAALRIELRTQGGADLSELNLDRLRFFLDAQPSTVHRLYELLLRDPQGLVVQSDDAHAPRVLGPKSIRPVGFSRDEGLLVYPPESFLGYRVLQEYFAYPEKLLFVDLSDLGRSAGNTLHLSVLLSESIAELDLRVRRHDLKLGCTPIVNLFEMNADPVRISQTAVEYPVIPDVRRPEAYEVYAIKRAVCVERGTTRGIPYEPIYTARHGTAKEGGAYWYAARRPSIRKDDSGTDVYVSLVDEKFNALAPPSDVLNVDVLCTNRDLPSRLPFGDARGDFDAQGQPGVTRVTSLRNPGPSLRSGLGQGSRWRVVSHLALNHLSLVGQGGGLGESPALDALREILKLYDFADSAATRQRIAGLIGLHTRPVVRRIEQGGESGFVRGTEVELLFDPELYAGSSVFLFASVLELFCGLYASINSFTQVVAHTRRHEGLLKRWPPRAGEMQLL